MKDDGASSTPCPGLTRASTRQSKAPGEEQKAQVLLPFPAAETRGYPGQARARAQSGAPGFLVLFFKKELLAFFLLFSASLLVGATGLGVRDSLIFWQIRVPRTILACLVGGGLGLSGAVLQGTLRNPLADPGLLGIGGCAAFGAVVMFYWGVAAVWPPALAVGALLGAGIGCAVLLGVLGRGVSAGGMILGGVALSAFASAFLALALSLAPNPFALTEITFWLMGGLEDRSLMHLAVAAPVIVAGCAILLRLGQRLDGLSLGEATAASLGMDVGITLRWVAVGVSLAVGGGAAVAGGIGFVGLVVPHLVRARVGNRPGALLWPSLFGGAVLLLGADFLARVAPLVLPLQAEPRLGVLTAMIGAPFLVIIARRAVG